MNAHRGVLPVSSSAASVPCTASRIVSVQSMTGRLPTRSASTPPPIITSTCGTTFAAKTKPRSAGPAPLSSTAKVSAIADIAEPSSDVA